MYIYINLPISSLFLVPVKKCISWSSPGSPVVDFAFQCSDVSSISGLLARSHMLHGQNTKTKWKQHCNKFRKDFKKHKTVPVMRLENLLILSWANMNLFYMMESNFLNKSFLCYLVACLQHLALWGYICMSTTENVRNTYLVFAKCYTTGISRFGETVSCASGGSWQKRVKHILK